MPGSILIPANVNAPVTAAGVLDGTAKPITFLFWSKIDTLPSSSTSNVQVMRTVGGASYLAARILQSSAIKYFGASSNDGGGFNSATYDLAVDMAGAWRCCGTVFASNTSRTVYTAIGPNEGDLLTATNTASSVTTGETGIQLLSGVWPTSAARYAHLTAYEGALTAAQFNEWRFTGAIAGLAPLCRWQPDADWGAGGSIPNTGSNATAITPPASWVYSTDSPSFSTGPNTAPVVSATQFAEFQFQITATDADGDPLTYSISTQGSHGTATVNGSGLVTYTPGGGFTTSDTITVAVYDTKVYSYQTINIYRGGIPSVGGTGLFSEKVTASKITASSILAFAV